MIMTGQYGATTASTICRHARRPEPDAPVEDIAKSHDLCQRLKSGLCDALSGKWQLSGEHPGLIRM